MVHFTPNDDGRVIDGKVVVFLPAPHAARGSDEAPAGRKDGAAPQAGEAAPDAGGAGGADAAAPARPSQEARASTAASQAAALEEAARDGTPFCEECERLRQELAREGGEE